MCDRSSCHAVLACPASQRHGTPSSVSQLQPPACRHGSRLLACHKPACHWTARSVAAHTWEGAVCDAADDLVAWLPHNDHRPARNGWLRESPQRGLAQQLSTGHACIKLPPLPPAASWQSCICRCGGCSLVACAAGATRAGGGRAPGKPLAAPHLCRRSNSRRQMYSFGMLGRHCRGSRAGQQRVWRQQVRPVASKHVVQAAWEAPAEAAERWHLQQWASVSVLAAMRTRPPPCYRTACRPTRPASQCLSACILVSITLPNTCSPPWRTRF